MEEIKKGVFYIGCQDKERRLFDEIIPLPEGTSYNAYLVCGREKNALIDTCDPDKTEFLLRELGETRIDYIISNHAEQDHSGSIPVLLEMFSDAKVVTNQKCKELLMSHLRIPEDRFIVVEDRDKLSIGDKTFEFFFAPWVHWPETMFTRIIEDNLLMTCDFLGSHLATDAPYADDSVILPAKRYYAEIMMPFASFVSKHVALVRELDPDVICPSHGPMHKDRRVLDAYDIWASDEVKNEAVIVFTSMHGSTRRMVEHSKGLLESAGVRVHVFDLVDYDLGELAMSLVDAASLIVASPTFLKRPHPLVLGAVNIIGMLKPKTRFCCVMGSHGWFSKSEEEIRQAMKGVKCEWLPGLDVNGLANLNEVEARVNAIIEKHKSFSGDA